MLIDYVIRVLQSDSSFKIRERPRPMNQEMSLRTPDPLSAFREGLGMRLAHHMHTYVRTYVDEFHCHSGRNEFRSVSFPNDLKGNLGTRQSECYRGQIILPTPSSYLVVHGSRVGQPLATVVRGLTRETGCSVRAQSVMCSSASGACIWMREELDSLLATIAS